jgi:hypothetical protein
VFAGCPTIDIVQRVVSEYSAGAMLGISVRVREEDLGGLRGRHTPAILLRPTRALARERAGPEPLGSILLVPTESNASAEVY